jgi:hypothetical protein
MVNLLRGDHRATEEPARREKAAAPMPVSPDFAGARATPNANADGGGPP